MTLEAVWLKNGKEIAWVDPVWEVENLDDCGDELGTVRVHNGRNWYRWRDLIDEEPDDFIVRLKREIKNIGTTNNSLETIDKAIDEINLLETIMETEKYPVSVYNGFREEVCAYCPCQECIQSMVDIVECPKFEDYYVI